ncbi:GIY-YIG nuclease family protein [Phenylobacterium soli]|uniref:Bacteriophage T5 Orf172 DNA-binding domain-containing protein n=1 Tax=Phenylobacterium soli TaxID=2170551 RepID=A0A328AAB1_9CAUL|nr:GIY-YIG nuclease family protein [Phenylobacterium soli]RAK51612.1 hypothetical protein DJ017_17400 [Phenylobacterium soli]
MIYVIRDSLSGYVKIGYAADPWRRLAKIQSDTPGEVRLVVSEEGDEEREAELHQQFAHCRTRGEWFAPDAALEAYIAASATPEKPAAVRESQAFWNGLTDAQVARATGFRKPYVSEVRRGLQRATPPKAIIFQRATGVSAIKLVFGDLADEAA